MQIANLKKINDKNWTRLEADVSWGIDQKHSVFFAVSSEYSQFIDEKSAEPFVMSFIQIAAKYNENIEVTGAGVAAQLAHNIENTMIPTLEKMGCGNALTKVLAPDYRVMKADEQIAATGISLGVDSFYTIKTNLSADGADKPISAVVYIYQVGLWEQFCEAAMWENLKKQEAVTKKYHLELIPIVTNIRSVMESELVFGQFHTFCNVGSIVLIRKLISRYYYSTGYSANEMKLSLADSAFYERTIQDVFCFDGFEMIASGAEVTRFEKTAVLADDPIVQQYLDVCYHDKEDKTEYPNCSCCAKCIRTMITLDILGRLDKFDNVFDLNLYQKNKAKNWADVMYRRIIGKDHFSSEIYKNAKKTRYPLPKALWGYFLAIGIRNQMKKCFTGKF